MLDGLTDVRLTSSFKKLCSFRIHIQGSGRSSSVEVWNQEVRHLIYAIGPCCGIFQVQTFVVMAFAVCCKLRSATHCVWGVFICRDELICICRDTKTAHDKKECRRDEESFDKVLMMHAEVDEHCNCVYKDYDGEIIGNLDMVCLNLHAECESKEHSSKNSLRQPCFPVSVRRLIFKGCPVCEDNTGKNPCKEGYGLHFSVVTHLDDLHVI